MSGHLPLTSSEGYAAFLQAQHGARSIAHGALRSCPPKGLECPPSPVAAIEADLSELGANTVRPSGSLSLANPAAALGAVWVLAGSSLGNRSMLAQRRKAGLLEANRFLSDASLARYFGAVLEILSQPHEAEEIDHAISGANATFALFETAFADCAMERAA